MSEIYIKLFNGEQDGWASRLEIESRWPEMFYIHRVADDRRINETKDPELREILSNSLAVLAYKFHSADPMEGVPGGRQFRYDRCESADRSLKDPAC